MPVDLVRSRETFACDGEVGKKRVSIVKSSGGEYLCLVKVACEYWV